MISHQGAVPTPVGVQWPGGWEGVVERQWGDGGLTEGALVLEYKP